MGGCFSPPMARVKAISWLLVGRPFGLDLLGPRHFAVALGDVVLDTPDRYLAPICLRSPDRYCPWPPACSPGSPRCRGSIGSAGRGHRGLRHHGVLHVTRSVARAHKGGVRAAHEALAPMPIWAAQPVREG